MDGLNPEVLNKKGKKEISCKTSNYIRTNSKVTQREVVVTEHVSLSDEGPLSETLVIFAISHGSYQPLNILHYLTLCTWYPIFLSLTGGNKPHLSGFMMY